MDIGVGDPCVGSVQLALNGLHISNPPLEVDHIYGNTTKSAVMAFQEKYGLTKDGVAGRATITKLFEATHVSQPPAAPAQTTPTTCTPHVGNTQGWIDCKGGSAPMWVRLSYVCSINAGPVHLRDQTYTTKWEMVEANSTHTISQECTQKILSAKGDMRPF